MTALTAHRPAAPPTGPGLRWVSAVAGGLAILLTGSCLVAVVQGTAWLVEASAGVAVVVVLGIALQRLAGGIVVAGQLAGLLLLLTALHGDGALALVVPTPASLATFGDHLREAAAQIDSGIAPVVPTPGMLFLITAAFGLVAVTVHAIAVLAGAPAAGGVPLLCLVAVPAALSDQLLPWWTVVLAAAGYGLLLVARDGAAQRGRGPVTGGIAVVAVAAVIGLLLGSAVTVVGTGGRFTSGGGPGGSGGAIGLNPFTSLRGQLTQNEPVELFRAAGLPRPTYLRALTLSDYRANTGWQAAAPRPGVPLAGPMTPDGAPGERVDVQVQNVGFRDYWLPLYGQPDSVTGVDAERWAYDQGSGIAYSQRPREEETWREVGVLPAPSADQLRGARGQARVDPVYLDTTEIDPRVAQVAQDATRGARTPFDRAVALVEYFTGPQSGFRYSLETAPGSGDDALVDFLTVGRTGYCEQYASAMAVMLRTLDVPARVAIGFTAGTDSGNFRSVTTRDAHAWVEAWFPGYGWITFDPTPLTDGRTVVPPYVQEAVGDTPLDPAQATPGEQDLQPGQAPDQAPEAEAPPPGQDAQPDAPATGAGGFPVLPVVVLVLLAASLAGPAVARAVLRRRRLSAAAAGGPGAGGAAWDELVATARDRGTALDDGDTIRGTARAIVAATELGERPRAALQELIHLVEAERYGAEPPAPGALDGPLGEVLAAVRGGGVGGWRRVVRALFPRSLLTSLPGRQLTRAG